MRHPPQDQSIPEQQRASTGIPGLDPILGGGLPANHLDLIEGANGVGKTTLGLQFPRPGLENGEVGLAITLSEAPAELRTVTRPHGWPLDGPERRDLRVVKMRGVRCRGGDHDFNLDTGSLSVFPRLVAAALRRGERAAYDRFDEGLGTLLLRSKALGLEFGASAS